MRTFCVSVMAHLLVATSVCMAPAGAQTLDDPNLHIETIQLSPNNTTGIRFVTPDEFFVIEKNTGRVLHFLSGVSSEALDLDVNFNGGERGLLGIELHPDFATNGLVYLYFSVTSGDDDSDVEDQWLSNVLARYEWNGAALVNETDDWASESDCPD